MNGRDKGRQDMKAIVHCGSERRLLNFGSERAWLWWKKADNLNNFAMRTSTGNTVVFGNGLAQSGGNIQKPRTAKLRRPCSIAFTNPTGGERKVLQECMKITAQATKGFQNAGQNSLALGGRVPRFLITFPDFRSMARMEKGTISVPLGQRITDGSINEKLFSCRSQSKNVHN